MIDALSPAAPQRITQAIARAADAHGIDFGYLLTQARIESGLNPAARARTSSATGLYQFVDQSWLATVARHGSGAGLDWAAAQIARGADGRYRIADPHARAAVLALRTDPEVAATMGAAHAADNRAFLEARTGRAAEPVDLYLAHFLGAGGAAKFLRADPETPGATLFPAAARANRAIFHAPDGRARTLGEIRARFAAKFEGGAPAMLPAAPPSPPPLPPGQARLAYVTLAALGVSA